MESDVQVADIVELKPGVWGFWATMGIALLIFTACFVVITFFVIALIIGVKLINPQIDLMTFTEGLTVSGMFMSFSTMLTVPVAVGLTIVFVKVRKGLGVGEYLGLKGLKCGQWVKWILVYCIFLVFSDGLTMILDREVVPETMIETYRTAKILPFLWLALVVGAPLWEEVFFRGFVYKGILYSRLGVWGAVIITALVWSVMHFQYDWYGVLSIFAAGLLLGVVRAKTGSLYLCIALHACQNLIATIQTAIVSG